jgi:prophage antirepressor-like protein
MNKNNSFFLDIFNHLLKINNTKIIIIFDEKGNIWFKYRDLLKALGYIDIDHTINKMKISYDNKSYYKNIKILVTGVDPSDQIHYNTILINESGLYEVLSMSKKELARKFMDKYFKEIMPKIRQTGQYVLNENDKNKLNKLNNKLDNYKDELRYYYDKYNFKPSDNGYLYINQNNSIKDGKEIKCFKIGYASDMTDRLTGYKVGNFKHKLLCFIPLDVNRKQIESCVKAKLKPHLLKLVTDTICYTTLEELKEDILDCIDQIKSHICHCTICKKKYEFNKITSHKCNNVEEFIDVNKKINSIGSKGSKKDSKLTKSSKGSKKRF